MRTRSWSDLLTRPALRRLRLRFGDLDSRMWLWNDFERLNSPVPVILNRFAAARRVFIFGMLNPPSFVAQLQNELRLLYGAELRLLQAFAALWEAGASKS